MYIFKFPKALDSLKLTYSEMIEYINKGRGNYVVRKVGTTITLTHFENLNCVSIKLYDTVIGWAHSDGTIEISYAINAHGSQATTNWVQRLLSDNRVGGLVGREKGVYAQAGRVYQPVAA